MRLSFSPVDSNARNYTLWIEWVVNGNLPFAFVDLPETKASTKLVPISSRILREYTLKVVEAIKIKIKLELASKYFLKLEKTNLKLAVMFDGWSAGKAGPYYLAVILTCSDGCVFSRRILNIKTIVIRRLLKI
jgi:hypothetical protein